MRLAQFSVHKPVTTLMIFVAMIVLGVRRWPCWGSTCCRRWRFPPSRHHALRRGGAEEIETLITQPIEDILSTISRVDDVLSVSKEGCPRSR